VEGGEAGVELFEPERGEGGRSAQLEDRRH
jgi:hypothetical protein